MQFSWIFILTSHATKSFMATFQFTPQMTSHSILYFCFFVFAHNCHNISINSTRVCNIQKIWKENYKKVLFFWLSWLYFIRTKFFTPRNFISLFFHLFFLIFCFTFDKAGELLPVWQRHDIKSIYWASESVTQCWWDCTIYILKILTWLNVTWWIYFFSYFSSSLRSLSCRFIWHIFIYHLSFSHSQSHIHADRLRLLC